MVAVGSARRSEGLVVRMDHFHPLVMLVETAVLQVTVDDGGIPHLMDPSTRKPLCFVTAASEVEDCAGGLVDYLRRGYPMLDDITQRMTCHLCVNARMAMSATLSPVANTAGGDAAMQRCSGSVLTWSTRARVWINRPVARLSKPDL